MAGMDQINSYAVFDQGHLLACRRESDPQLTCHLNSVYALAFMDKHGRHTSCPHHHHRSLLSFCVRTRQQHNVVTVPSQSELHSW